MKIVDLKETLAKYEDRLMQLPNVVGVGSGEKGGKPALVVFVTHKVPAAELAEDHIVPKLLDGHPTDVVAIGAVQAQSPHQT